jgi:hypothetical protein
LAYLPIGGWFFDVMTSIPSAPNPEASPQTGHRPSRRPYEPRNSTVCFTIAAQEKLSSAGPAPGIAEKVDLVSHEAEIAKRFDEYSSGSLETPSDAL